MTHAPPPIVLSLGGSIVVPPTGIDADYLRSFRALILREVRRSHRRFILVIGGGATARQYQRAAAAVHELEKEDIDWLGIHATRLNGHLLRTVFRDIAQHRVMKDPTRPFIWNRPVLIAAGWKPGWSTDYIAVRLARRFGSREVINLSNIDMVYDKDPSRYRDATPRATMTWKEMRALVGTTWVPGANVPFDPVATALAAKSDMRVTIANGRSLDTIRAILHGKRFRGTVVEGV